MAIYTNLDMVEPTYHGMFESSLLIATDAGKIHDVIVRDDDETEIAVDNGVAVKLGAWTHDGLQTRYATIAKKGDKVVVTGSPAVVKDAFTTQQAAEYNFYHKPGVVAKAYQVRGEDEADSCDIFAVAQYQFTEGAEQVKEDAYVVVDEKGGWKAQAEEPTESEYGFIGQVHSIATNEYYPMVRVAVIKNKQVTE